MAAKSNKAKIAFLKTDGTEADNVASGDIAVIQFRFADGLGTLDVDLAKVGQSVLNTAMVRGVAEKIRDDYAGADSADEAMKWAKDIVERLYSDEWYGEREGGGPSISLFVEAVKAVKAKAGLPFDEEATRAKYVGKDKAKTRNAALAGNSDLRATHANLVAQQAAETAKRAAERAAKAAAAAGAEAPTGDAAAI